MNVRSVSPLIATIVLISLTIAIGAIIVGWGRAYVQKQTSCLGASVMITKTILNTSSHQITIGFVNTGEQKLDPTKIYAILYTASGRTFKCLYVAGNELPEKLPCGLFNPVDANGNNVTIVNPENYVEYTLIYNNNTIQDSELQFNSFIQIGYGSCNEISEKSPIS